MLIDYNVIASVVIGLFFGISVAYGIVSSWVRNSNDHGEIDDEFESFSQYPMIIFESKDNLNKPYFKP